MRMIGLVVVLFTAVALGQYSPTAPTTKGPALVFGKMDGGNYPPPGAWSEGAVIYDPLKDVWMGNDGGATWYQVFPSVSSSGSDYVPLAGPGQWGTVSDGGTQTLSPSITLERTLFGQSMVQVPTLDAGDLALSGALTCTDCVTLSDLAAVVRRRLPIAGAVVAGSSCPDPGDGGSECVMVDDLNITRVVRTGTGQYIVQLTTSAGDIYYTVSLSVASSSTPQWELIDSSSFIVSCTDTLLGTDENCTFSVLVHDFKAD